MKIATPKRRRLRISLRVLMTAVLVAGVWIGGLVNKTRRQREAVAAVKKYGGWVYYDWEFVDGRRSSGTQPYAPRWLRKVVGDAFFQDIVEVNLVYDGLSGESARKQEPADEVLSYIRGFDSLRTIRLTRTQPTDAGLKHLSSLTNLEELWLIDATRVSDASIAHLANLKSLRRLHFVDSTITDQNLRDVGSHGKLEHLSLLVDHLSDSGLAKLEHLANLNQLVIHSLNASISDRGLVPIGRLQNLEWLILEGTGTSDEGLQHLKGLSKLIELRLMEPWVTEEGIRKLKEALPDAKITR